MRFNKCRRLYSYYGFSVARIFMKSPEIRTSFRCLIFRFNIFYPTREMIYVRSPRVQSRPSGWTATNDTPRTHIKKTTFRCSRSVFSYYIFSGQEQNCFVKLEVYQVCVYAVKSIMYEVLVY